MKFHRLKLTNYRGIDECEIVFAPSGLTVIQGPNEIGKTSLSEAIQILFTFPDSSKKEAISRITPVDKDVGPEITLEAECGFYEFTYFKRFTKKPATELIITKPKPENCTGREAHDRADAILHETVDVDLWRALSIDQGVGTAQADFSRQIALSAALDKVASGGSADPQTESLYEQVRQEYLQYFTERGSEKKELVEARRSEATLRDEAGKMEGDLRSLEDDADQVAHLEKELKGIDSTRHGQERELLQLGGALSDIAELETAVEKLRNKSSQALSAQKTLESTRTRRHQLIDKSNGVGIELQKLEASQFDLSLTLQRSETDLALAKSAEDKSKLVLDKSETRLRLAQEDADYFNDKLHLELLEERLERIDEARERAAAAQNILRQYSVDENSLKEIEDAEKALLAAESRLKIDAPTVHLTALRNLEVGLQGDVETLQKDDKRTLKVRDSLLVQVPGSLIIEVTAGSSAADLSDSVGKARQVLEGFCRKAGVENVGEARTAYQRRQGAKLDLEASAKTEHEALRDLTYDDVKQKVLQLRKSVPAYLDRRSQDQPLPADLQEAKNVLLSAGPDVVETKRSWGNWQDSTIEARTVRDLHKDRLQCADTDLAVKRSELSQTVEELEQDRKQIPDEALESRYEEASQVVQAEATSVLMLEQALAGKSPERTKSLKQTLEASLLRLAQTRESVVTDLSEVRARLKVKGEEGLQERLDTSKRQLQQMSRDNAALFRRAESASLLFRTMQEERDRVRRAYVAPIKAKVEYLGRLLFGGSFQVDIDQDLAIASRTLDRVTVPFKDLSGGAKEQLSLIARLAAAMIVSKDGGAPLLLDDALGYTDPDRLMLMGVIIAKASQDCQIIVLTCVPERYSNVGEAKVVRMI